jgi:hypothetical protein
MTFLGRIPRAGDVFSWEGLRFEVRAMKGSRVRQVLVNSSSCSREWVKEHPAVKSLIAREISLLA